MCVVQVFTHDTITDKTVTEMGTMVTMDRGEDPGEVR